VSQFFFNLEFISWAQSIEPNIMFLYFTADVIVQTFLQKIALARKEKNFLIPKYDESSFVKLLLNRHVTEFDMIKFNDECMRFDQEYFNHLSDCCPNINRIRFFYDEDRDQDEADVPVPLEMKKNWPNLIHLDLGGAVFRDEELKELRIQFPQLE
jgi:hypothetical protein